MNYKKIFLIEAEIPENQVIEYGVPFSYDLNANDNIGVDEYWINEANHFQITSKSVITNTTVVDSDTYTLSIRAYDSSGNYISTVIRITIDPKSTPSRCITGFKSDFIGCTAVFTILLLYFKNLGL